VVDAGDLLAAHNLTFCVPAGKAHPMIAFLPASRLALSPVSVARTTETGDKAA